MCRATPALHSDLQDKLATISRCQVTIYWSFHLPRILINRRRNSAALHQSIEPTCRELQPFRRNVSISLNHGLCLPPAQALQFVRRCSCLAVPGCKRMPQVIPAEAVNTRQLQCLAPGLGIDLQDGIAFVGKHMHRVIALALFQHIERGLVERYRVWAAVRVFGP